MTSSNRLDQVKKLREITGVGFKDCNIALTESDGDMELTAVEYLKNSSEWKSWVSAEAAAGVEGAL